MPPFETLDIPVALQASTTGLTTRFALAVSIDDAMALLRDRAPVEVTAYLDDLTQLLSAKQFRLTSDDLVWIKYDATPGTRMRGAASPVREQIVEAAEDASSRVLSAMEAMSRSMTGSWGGERHANMSTVITKALNLVEFLQPVRTIGAFRQVLAGGDDFGGYSGEGIIAGLARLQDPDAASASDRAEFDAVNQFVRIVLDDERAALRIPHHRQTINVDLGGRLLPLTHLGTGVQEVVILASAATLLKNHFVCIEEPEIHLHPLLQRKLLGFLATQTSNRYLIATHSAHLLDSSVATIFSVRHTGTETNVIRASSPKQLAQICSDLGYRPSDLIQANAILWVEGPSDRIYLRRWLQLEDPLLFEGIHYSIMFYGGRLLSHLSADDPDVDDFVSLRRLNRNIAIVIDSDKASARARLNATKIRVSREFEEGPGLAWVTSGYTIENYVPSELLQRAIGVVHPKARSIWTDERYANPLGEPMLAHRPGQVDKVAIARQVVAELDSSTRQLLDLASQLRRLVGFVREANGMGSAQ